MSENFTIFFLEVRTFTKFTLKINSPFVAEVILYKPVNFIFQTKECFHTFGLYMCICTQTNLKDSILNVSEEIQ